MASGTLDSEPPRRRRRRWQAVAGLSVLVIALAVFAWQHGGDGGGGPLNAIAAAAERTQAEPAGRVAMRMVFSSPDPSEALTMRGQGVFDDESGRSRMVMTFPDPESDDMAKMEMVGDETVIYMRSSLFGSLPEGHRWMGLDLSFGEGFDTPVPSEGDPKGELEILEEALGVRKLGRESVRGVPTTRYSGTVGVTEQTERLREEGKEEVASYLEENGTPLQLEVWIDSDVLIRRMRLVKTEPREEGGGSKTMDMRVDFFDFGPVPEIDLPESSEVFDVTGLARDEIGLSDDD